MSEIVYIGKGTCRLNVTTKFQRRRLAKLPGVKVVDNRAIFPEQMKGIVHRALDRKRRPKADAAQLDIGFEI